MDMSVVIGIDLEDGAFEQDVRELLSGGRVCL